MSGLSWETLWERYAQGLRVRGRSETTLASYRKAWHKFVAAVELTDPRAVEPHHLEHHGAQLLANPRLSTATASAKLRPVLQVFRWAARAGLLLLDPGAEVVLRRPERPVPSLLSVAQVQGVLEAVGGRRGVVGLRDRALVELLYGTGVRAGELSALDLADLDLAGASLAVRRGKSRRERLLPLGEAACEALAVYLERSRPRLAEPVESALFVTTRGGRMSARIVSLMLYRAGQRLGLLELTPHALRRAFASHMLENGANLATLRAFLGHAELRSTERYTLLRPVELERTYRASHPRARRRRPRPDA